MFPFVEEFAIILEGSTSVGLYRAEVSIYLDFMLRTRITDDGRRTD